MNQARLAKFLPHVVLVIGVAISMFPFYWSLVLATNTSRDVFRYHLNVKILAVDRAGSGRLLS